MAKKAIYDASDNSLQEQSEMDKPKEPNPSNYTSTASDEYFDAKLRYNRRLKEYRAHTASLRKVFCSQDCRKIFQNGRAYQADKDYSIELTESAWVAVPLDPPKGEDEARYWQIVIAVVIMKHQKSDTNDEIIEALMSEFNITKKQ